MTITPNGCYEHSDRRLMPPRMLDTEQAKILAGKAEAAFRRSAGPEAADLLAQAIDVGRGHGLNGSPVELRRQYNTLAANQTWKMIGSMRFGSAKQKAVLDLHRYTRASGGFKEANRDKLDFTEQKLAVVYNGILTLGQRKDARRNRKPALF